MKTAEIFLEDMRKKQEEQNQEKILDEFFKEAASYNMGGVVWWVVIFMDILAGIFMCFPYQELVESEMLVSPAILFGINGVSVFVQGHHHFTENGKSRLFYEKIKYLPISKGTLYKWRMKQLIRYCTKRTCVFFGLQFFFTLVCIRHFTLGNFLYPLLMGFVIPVGIFSISNYIEK